MKAYVYLSRRRGNERKVKRGRCVRCASKGDTRIKTVAPRAICDEAISRRIKFTEYLCSAHYIEELSFEMSINEEVIVVAGITQTPKQIKKGNVIFGYSSQRIYEDEEQY